MAKILIFRNDSGPIEEMKNALDLIKSDSTEYHYNSYTGLRIYLPRTQVPRVTVDSTDISEFHLVFFRKTAKNHAISSTLGHFLSNTGVKHIDTAISKSLYGSKLLQLVQLYFKRIPIPTTIIFSKDILGHVTEEEISILGTPFIFKSASGSKGENNYLLTNTAEIHDLAKADSLDTNYIVQEYIPNDFDYRVLVLGNDAPVVIKRVRNTDTTHLNNVAQGAEEIFLDPKSLDKSLIRLAIRAAKTMYREVAGVDIVVNKIDGKPYVLEVNPAPGFTYDVDLSPEVRALNAYLEQTANASKRSLRTRLNDLFKSF